MEASEGTVEEAVYSTTLDGKSGDWQMGEHLATPCMQEDSRDSRYQQASRQRLTMAQDTCKSWPGTLLAQLVMVEYSTRKMPSAADKR
jgi:hypothetical protein